MQMVEQNRGSPEEAEPLWEGASLGGRAGRTTIR
jgi:hypothetical protein